MSGWRDLDDVRQPLPLDDWIADRLLAGMVDPDDAPPGYAGLARALSQTRGPVEAAELAGRELIVAAVTAAVADASPPTNVSTSPRRRPMISRLLGTKVAAATIASVLLATGAAAATGSLPGPVQGIVSDAADNVGVNLPDGDTDAPETLPVVDEVGDDDGIEGDHEDADEVGDDNDDQGDHDDADEVGDGSDPVADPDVPGDPESEKGTPASQEGVNAHIVRDLRHSDDPAAAGTTDWKSVRDGFHDAHKADHAADPASADDASDEHLATVAEQKAERDALKDERAHDDADEGDDVADEHDADDDSDDVADEDDADEDSDDVADEDDADDEDDDEGKTDDHDDDEHEDDEAEDAPTAS